MVCNSITGRNAPQSAAFTLVELLVVIGIIAALIAVLMPALSKARDSARTLQCLSNLREINNALIMYTQQNRACVPMASVDDWSTPAANRLPNWRTHFVDHYKLSARTMECPVAPGGRQWVVPSGTVRYFTTTSDATANPRLHYAINASNNGLYSRRNDQWAKAQDVAGGPIVWRNIRKLKQSSKVMSFTESANTDWVGGGNGYGNLLVFRHAKGKIINVAYFDGHVGSVQVTMATGGETNLLECGFYGTLPWRSIP